MGGCIERLSRIRSGARTPGFVSWVGMDTLLSKAAQDPPSKGMAEKRDLLARLLGRLAHAIRNPLSSLDIHVQLLAEDVNHAPTETRQQMSGRLEIIRGE